MRIRAKLIKRNSSKASIQPGRARAILQRNLKQFMKDNVYARFHATFYTWKRQPKFTTTVQARIDGISGKVASEDPIYAFVSFGTRVRYATMTPDFVAKTKPRIIGSGYGAGGLAYIDKRQPRPGIEAREFVETIGEQMEPELFTMLDRIFATEIWL